jgi:hypothetical protein
MSSFAVLEQLIFFIIDVRSAKKFDEETHARCDVRGSGGEKRISRMGTRTRGSMRAARVKHRGDEGVREEI